MSLTVVVLFKIMTREGSNNNEIHFWYEMVSKHSRIKHEKYSIIISGLICKLL